METPTLEDAREIVERMKVARPTCPSCDVIAYDVLLNLVQGVPATIVDRDGLTEDVGEVLRRHLDEEWEPSPNNASFFRRCATCREARTYPWASKLDAERVLAHMKTKVGAWALNELETLI